MRFRSVSIALIGTMLLLWVPAASAQKRVVARVTPNAGSINGDADIFDPYAGTMTPAAGTMAKARQSHVAITLDTGKVLLAGGYNDQYLSSAELFDPATGGFTAVGNMSTARIGAAAVLLHDGTAYIVGGYNGTFLSSADVYDPSAQTFSTSSAYLLDARENATATLLFDGRVLIAGGYGLSSSTSALGFLNSVEIFDPPTKTINTASTMNTGRQGHSATLLPDGRVLVAGGCTNSESGITLCNQYVATAEIYDPSTGAWTKTGDMKTPRIGHTASLLPNGTVLIAGGTDQNKARVAAAEIYDPTTGQFTQTGSLATPRTGHTATTLLDGRILIAGGYSDHYLSSAEIYDQNSKAFTRVSAPMSKARTQHAAAVLQDGRVLLSGGQNSDLLLFDINYQEPLDNVAPDVIFSSDSKTGFVPYAGSGVILAFSTETGSVIKQIVTGGKPQFMTLLPDGNTLAVVSAFDNRIFLIGMDSLSLKATYSFNGSFGFGSRLTIFPATNTGYISSTSTGEVIKFNLLNGQELGRLKNVMTPAQITLTKDGSTLMVVDTTNNEVDFADTATMTAKYKMKPDTTTYPYTSFTIFNKPVLNQDGSLGLIGSQDAVPDPTTGTGNSAFIFNTSTGDIVSRQVIGTTPGYTTLFPDGAYWAVLSLDNISLIPTSADYTPANFAFATGTPASSGNVVITPDSRYAFYAASDRVALHDLATDAVIGSVLVGDNPNASNDQASVLAVTPDGKTMAVVDAASNELDLLADSTIQRQTKFVSQQDFFTGLSLVNLSGSPTNVEIAAIADGGTDFAVTNATNPATLQLGPNAQASIDVGQLFGLDPSQSNSGHLSITSDQPVIAGYSIVGQIRSAFPGSYLNTVEPVVLYPDYRKPLYDFIIPEIPQASGTFSELNFVNPNYNTSNFEVTHYATDGTSIEQKTDNSLSGSTRSTLTVSGLVTTAQAGQVLIVGGASSASSTNTTAENFDLTSNTFSITAGAPGTPRQGHTSTVLPNEKVLIAGGKNSFAILNSAEIYDPTSGTFSSTTGTMNRERNRHTATSLADGEVLIAGGQSSSSINNTAELFDPITNSFSLIPALMNSPRDGHTATRLADGTVLLTGGNDGVSVSSTAEIYDPVSSTFKRVGNMTTGRAFHTAVLLPNGKVLIAGGYNGDYLASAEIYDPSTGSFSAAQSMAAARRDHTCTLLSNGTVLIAGGLNSSGVLSSAEIYNPASGKFASVGKMASARTSHTATLLSDSSVLIAGGTDGTNVLNTAERYDPTAQVFTATSGAMTAARQGHTATLLYGADQGYLRVTSKTGVLFTEAYGYNGPLTAINGIDVNKFAGITKIYSPQFAIVPQSFATSVNIINANQDSAANVSLTVHAPDGHVLAGPASFVLPKNAQVKGDLLAVFQNNPALQNQTGWLEINSSVDRVVGTVSMTMVNSSNNYLTSFEFSGTPLTDFVFPLVAEDSTYDTGVTLLNADDQPAHAVVELWGPAGTKEATVSVTIAPHTQLARTLGGLFPGMQPHTTANVRVHSDQPLYGNAYFYDRAMHFVSTVPPVAYPGQ
jgi:N-acetylneuraminic acid mutarotase